MSIPLSTITLKISPERKKAIQHAADQRGENLTEFIMKSIMFRVSNGAVEEIKTKDPFLIICDAKVPTPEERIANEKANKRVADGTATLISPEEAKIQLLAAFDEAEAILREKVARIKATGSASASSAAA